ncbi:MAG: SDR family oxidoreductase [Planctomycetota bacterium]|nr:SDR family oxidoreductase [Planctomycetota bacterium]
MSLAGKVALVTGGTGALGRAVVQRLVRDGAAVHVPCIVKAELEDCRKTLGEVFAQATIHEANVAREAEVEKLFAAVASKSGRLDVLANIVGGFAFAALSETDPATWQRMLELNATTCFLCCRAAAPLMKRSGGGRIVNVSAGPAINRGVPNMSAYGASKAAVLNLTQTLAQELGADRITVNALVPSIIDTPANRKAMPEADTSTWLAPAEIANVIGFLASPEGAIVTGAALTLSRG